MREKENKLFEDWKQRRKEYGDDSDNCFVSDGIPCQEQFECAKYRITFVLKDPNDFDPSGKEYGRDMRKCISEDGGVPRTWNNITRWTQAILDEGCVYPEKPDRFDWLKKISFLNLKKINGGSSVDKLTIWKYAEEDKDLIRRQLELYKPDIIICCGKDLVGDCLHDLVLNHKKDDWDHSYENEYYDCCNFFYTKCFGKETAVLNSYHPVNRGTGYTNEALFKAIKNVAPKLLAKR